MLKFLNSSRISSIDLSLLLLRLVGGGFMIYRHGWKKLMKAGEIVDTFSDPLGVGSQVSYGLTIFAEVICAAALIVGWKTRWAAIPLAITMAVAAFIVHGEDGFAKQELPLLFFVIYLVSILSGPGKYSMDARLKG